MLYGVMFYNERLEARFRFEAANDKEAQFIVSLYAVDGFMMWVPGRINAWNTDYYDELPCPERLRTMFAGYVLSLDYEHSLTPLRRKQMNVED